MLTSWVDAVWSASQNGNVHCDDEIFQSHRCPPFYNLVISVTGFTEIEERLWLEKVITDNGGKYSGHLRTEVVDVLVCHGYATTLSICTH